MLSFSVRNTTISFKPTLWPTLGFVILLPLFISLGLWQWHRAEAKQSWLERYSATGEKSTLSLDQALEEPKKFDYLPLRLEGHYLGEHQFLQENQFFQYQVGYFVLTPFITKDNRLILVNRGWIPKDFSAEQLQLKEKPLLLKGRIRTAPSYTFHLGENLSADPSWPRRIQVIKIPELSSLLQELPLKRETPSRLSIMSRNNIVKQEPPSALNPKLEPLLLLLNPEEPNGFGREWQPGGISPEKHRGYALQWFAFATLLVVLFLVLNISYRNRSS